MLRKISFVLLLVTPAATPAAEMDMAELLKNKIRIVQHMALNPLLVKAVRLQNSEALSSEMINQRELDWKANEESAPLKNSMLAGYHADIMRRFVDDNPAFTRIYLTDNKGANVAAYPLTDDYWQGDEEEWIKSFNEGSGQVFIGPLEQDPKTKSILTHVSAPVLYRARTIGVLVVDLRLGGEE